jgi:hypothetical protein
VRGKVRLGVRLVRFGIRLGNVWDQVRYVYGLG